MEAVVLQVLSFWNIKKSGTFYIALTSLPRKNARAVKETPLGDYTLPNSFNQTQMALHTPQSLFHIPQRGNTKPINTPTNKNILLALNIPVSFNSN